MGNALLRFLCGCGGGGGAASGNETQFPGPRSGVAALVHDLHHFDVTSQVPEGLSQHVVSSKKAQANWYKKLSEAWSGAKPPPRTPEEASRLVIQTLKRHQKADVKVDAKSVADGDTITVYVDTADTRESGIVPREVHEAAIARAEARAVRNYQKADALQKTIADAGYRVISSSDNEEILARKYRIRLRGIDAPESSMPFGKEAKEELVKLIQGKRLKIYVFGDDRYGRCVGDVYCNGVLVQEHMLKKGLAWHYTAYDQRPELAKVEKQARAKRMGLWSASDPEKPWEWRRDRRNKGA